MTNNLSAALLAAALIGASCGAIAQTSGGHGGAEPRMLKVADQGAIPSKKDVQASIRDKNWPQAERQLRQVLDVKAKDATAWYYLAQVQDKMGKRSEAKAALAKASSLDPALKFASPGAIASLERRLGGQPRQSASARPRSEPIQAPSAEIAGYNDRPAVGSTSYSSPQPSRPAPTAPASPASYGWVAALLALAAAGAGAWFFFNKRAKEAKAAEGERERRGLLARANSVQERASALQRTARFESQESSAFGVAAKSAASKATSALGRLNSISASVDAYREKRTLDELERDVEALETQAARKAWDEEPVQPRDPPAGSGAPVSTHYQGGAPHGGSGYPGGAPSPYSGHQGAPSTVVVNQGPDLLTAMVLGGAFNANHNDHARERDLERQLDRERERSRELERDQERERSYQADPEPSSSFDFGSGGSNWGDDSSSSSFDTGTSNSSSWEDSSSSDSSSSDSSSSSDDDAWK
jgi:tetratricopeptide (TPR) repeat protein